MVLSNEVVGELTRIHITEKELLERFPSVGWMGDSFSTAYEVLLADRSLSDGLDRKLLDEVGHIIYRTPLVFRDEQSVVWVEILKIIQRDMPHLRFWRGDYKDRMLSAGSAQFCLGDTEYIVGWGKAHGKKEGNILLASMDVTQLENALGSKKIRMSHSSESITSQIGWFIGVNNEGDNIAKYCDIYELVMGK